MNRPTEPRHPDTETPTRTQPPGRSLKLAVVTGLVLAGMAVGLLILGPDPFMGFVVAMILLAQGEFYSITRKAGYDPATALGLVAGAVLLIGTYLRGETTGALVLFFVLVFSFAWYLASEDKTRIVGSLSITILGVAYPALLGSFVALLLKEYPRPVLLAGLGATALYDVFAYAAGSRWGRTAFAPKISPKKTVEGAVVATVIIVVLTALIAPRLGPWNTYQAALLGFLVSVAAPFGDLFESLIKRDLGIKDTSRVFPGHGGALDRFDAILFAAPVIYLSLQIFGL